MSVSKMDRSLKHLFPPFREDILRLIEQLRDATGEPWTVVEGFRSNARQLWLYASGRTRPGPVVTWMRSPTWHGTGIAVDIAPTRVLTRGYRGIPDSHWHTLRRLYSQPRFGLKNNVPLNNPAWGRGDFQHVQLTDHSLRLRSLQWVRAGFKPETVSGMTTDTPSVAQAIRVYVCGEKAAGSVQEVGDARARMVDGRVQVWLRPVTDALGWGIAHVEKGVAELVLDPDTDPNVTGAQPKLARVPLRIVNVGAKPYGYVQVNDLRAMCAVGWDGGKQSVYIAESASDLPAHLR